MNSPHRWAKGWIVLVVVQKTTLGSLSSFGEYGIARKPAYPLPTPNGYRIGFGVLSLEAILGRGI
jgi:hypothetical protein